ncbi:MAG TPA: hypothetical protein VGG25_10250 [Streptosporangiaceae bacterium]
MGRVIAIGPGGRSQAPARRDTCRPVIDWVLDRQLLDRTLLSPPCTSWLKADRLRKDLYLSCRYYCTCGQPHCTRKYRNIPPDNGCPRGGQRISCRAEVVYWTDPADGIRKLCVQFRLHDKTEAMREVVRKYGPDPNAWPYFSRRKIRKE